MNVSQWGNVLSSIRQASQGIDRDTEETRLRLRMRKLVHGGNERESV